MDYSYQRDNIYQIIEAIINELSYDGDSRSIIADILISILETTPYTGESPKSVIGQLLLKLKDKLEGNDPEPYEDTEVSNIAKILISIINETEYTDPPRSNIAELLLELKEKLETLVEITVTGNPVTFTTNVARPLKACSVNIPVMQEGSGDPSPDNVRNFIGVNSLTFGSIEDNEYKSFFEGVIKGTYGFADLGDMTFFEYGSTEDCTQYYTTYLDNLIKANADCISPKFMLGSVQNKIPWTVAVASTGAGRTYFRTPKDLYANPAAFKTAMQGVYLIYELAEPTTPSYTEAQFNALCNAFGVTGISKTFNFGQTVYVVNTDILTGKSFVTHILKTIDENSDISMSTTGTGIFYLNNFFEIDEDTESINSNRYQRAENRSSVTGVINNNPDLSFCCKLDNYPTRILIKDTRFTTLADYQTWLSTNPVKIAVKLVTPIEIDLEGMDIITNIGENNLISNLGDISATYLYKDTNE